MRVCKRKSDGRIIEMQSGGDPGAPHHTDCMISNAVAAGYSADEVAVAFVDDAAATLDMRNQMIAEVAAEEEKVPIADKVKRMLEGNGLTIEQLAAELKKVK